MVHENSPASSAGLFASEASWPFALHRSELEECLQVLGHASASGPTVLRIFGASGSGKSFLVRELLTQFAMKDEHRTVIYLDAPAADLESSAIFERFDKVLGQHRNATRDTPIQISKRLASKWNRRKKRPLSGKAAYAYRVTRDLVAQIPVAGPFIKALLPSTLAFEALGDRSHAAAFRHILAYSKAQDVLIALDNVQFLPELVREMIERELGRAGQNLRLILIERTRGSSRIDWLPRSIAAHASDIELEAAELNEVQKLVSSVLPTHDDPEMLAVSLHRRSAGNLKSIWFQLKLIAERSEHDTDTKDSLSYEGVISSLNPPDQSVLQFIVFLLGGLSISHLIRVFGAADVAMDPESISSAISDLTALGLVVINSESQDRVKIEHEIVSHVVSDLTPEDDKLELRQRLVQALDQLLAETPYNQNDQVLYDRLLGITSEADVRSSASLQSHIVRFVDDIGNRERFTYASTLLRDSVCWDVLDLIPRHTLKALLDAIQKCALFSFGLVTTERMKTIERHRELASLFEAKFLVQLFRYEDAIAALEMVPKSEEKELVSLTILLNLCRNTAALEIVQPVQVKGLTEPLSEIESVILRNSGHLFNRADAVAVLRQSVRGFEQLGLKFGLATALNNLAIAEINNGDIGAAKRNLAQSEEILLSLESAEVYQPLVNLAGASLMQGRLADAKELLRDARRSAPDSLAMDQLLFEFNERALDIISTRSIKQHDLEHIREIHQRAVRLKDLRFTETIAWFVAGMEQVLGSNTRLEFDQATLSEVLDETKCGMELFKTIPTPGGDLAVPYILSPHWRY